MDAFIYGGRRSPFGKHAGALAGVRPDDLAATVIRAVVAEHPFPTEAIEDVVLGCTNQAGEDSRNVARHAALAADLPVGVGGITVNRLCASGLAAVVDAARAVAVGEGDLFLAGGVESMSRAPFVLAKAESAYSRDAKIFDTTLGTRFPNPKILAAHGAHSMPETGDAVAAEYAIERAACDAFAARSQELYEAARRRGFFEGELTPITLPTRKNAPPVVVSTDEHPRADSNIPALARLQPLFQGGVVTAGNASGINDGAAVVYVGSRAIGERHGVRPLARVVASGVAGIEPRIMGVGPVKAIKKALARAKLTLSDMQVIEINEAFAAQVLACAKLLELKGDDKRLNPNGGAIAVGHPLGASGGRLTLTAARQLQQSGGRYALVSLCIGIGQGLAVVLERS